MCKNKKALRLLAIGLMLVAKIDKKTGQKPLTE
jgi:hypothetical protein